MFWLIILVLLLYIIMIKLKKDDGQAEIKRKVFNIPATLISRSPLKQVEQITRISQIQNNKNSIYTPNKNSSISPYPFRYKSPNSKPIITKSVLITNNNQNIHYNCTNHPQRKAKFYVITKDQMLLYCQKCGIMLASQGFNIFRVSETPNSAQTVKGNQQQVGEGRKQEVYCFLTKLEEKIYQMQIQQASISKIIQKTKLNQQSQISKVERYYDQIIDIITDLKKTAIKEVQLVYNISGQIQNYNHIFQYLNQCGQMKKDIYQSLKTVIPSASQQQYRGVMNLYYAKLNQYQLHKIKWLNEVQKKIIFQDPSQMLQNVRQKLKLKWEDSNEKSSIQKQFKSKSEQITFNIQDNKRYYRQQCLVSSFSID